MDCIVDGVAESGTTAIVAVAQKSPLQRDSDHQVQIRPPSYSVQFSSVAQSCPTLRPHESQHARPPCPSPTPGVQRLTSIKSVMPTSHLILCRPLLLLPPIPPSIRVLSNESALLIRCPKHQLPECTQTHVHRVGDAIQPSHPLSSSSPPAPNPSQHHHVRSPQ